MRSILHVAARVRASLCSIALLAILTTNPSPAAAAVSLTFHWTAPGDDGTQGRATLYDLRWSTAVITPANFASATPLSGLPAPSVAGAQESFTAVGLQAGPLYFALKTKDDAGNWSALSNVMFWTGQTTDAPPATITFSSSWPNPARATSTFAYSIGTPGPVEVDIYDAAGRHVRRVATGWRPAGRGEIAWDLRDEAGQRVAPGLYLLHAQFLNQRFVRRVAVVA